MKPGFILSISIVFLQIIPLQARADSADLTKAIIHSYIRADGTVKITEQRTYQFNGNFHWATRNIPLKGFNRITDIKISEDGHSYTNKNSETPGTFSVKTNGNQTEIKWYYDAKNESRTFTVSYVLHGALTIGPGWSQFYWNFIGENWKMNTQQLQIEIHFDSDIPSDSMHVWKHSQNASIQTSKNNSLISFTGKNVEAGSKVQIRTLFPTSYLSNVSVNDPKFSLTAAREMENKYQRTLAEQSEREKWGSYLAALTAVVSMLAFLFFFLKYGKRFKIRETIPKKSLKIPDSNRPAIVGWLMNSRTIQSGHLLATLLDLSRRGFFRITEKENDDTTFFGNKKGPVFEVTITDAPVNGNLLDWEKMLYRFIQKRIDNGISRLDQIFKNNRAETQKWFSTWKKSVNQYARQKQWFDKRSQYGAIYNLIAQIVLFLLSLGTIIWLSHTGVFPMITSLFLAILSLAIYKRTYKGEVTYKQWKAYRDGLKNSMQSDELKQDLERHYINAIALGLTKDRIESLLTGYPDEFLHFYWFIPLHSGSSITNLANSMSTLAATGASSFPGVSGGTGASAGTAGGGGGGAVG